MPAPTPLGAKHGPRAYNWLATEHGHPFPSGPI